MLIINSISSYICVVKIQIMTEFKEKYVNPFTDYGFKKLFGEELNKDLLLDFLNELLKDEQGQIKSLTYIKSEKLGDTEVELETRFDKWLYVIRNLNKLDRIPDNLRESIFEKVFATAEIAKFTPKEIRSYEDSLKYYRDLKNSLDTAKEEGIDIGRLEEREKINTEIVLNAQKMKMNISDISLLTGLSEEIIKKIIDKNGCQ